MRKILILELLGIIFNTFHVFSNSIYNCTERGHGGKRNKDLIGRQMTWISTLIPQLIQHKTTKSSNFDQLQFSSSVEGGDGLDSLFSSLYMNHKSSIIFWILWIHCIYDCDGVILLVIILSRKIHVMKKGMYFRKKFYTNISLVFNSIFLANFFF